ncbi:hypothetical protein HMN09_00939600 [Mycena chlorophos]|uniref:Uncharacterized protein n=1 Tax=Mycena chlorophos TaxID=658473 RepID=A0A8H6SKJ5_MYCCL|nr:hypothetical protein HMN09_00939600 [Mycena chlorophos]
MPLAPRTLAITWAGIALIDLACMSILAVEVARHDPGDSNLKYRIVALVLLALASLFSALASWRWYRVHRLQGQIQAAAAMQLPSYYPGPAPPVGVGAPGR